MYVPARFRETDHEVIRSFMRAHSFAVLVTVDGTRPVATHVPVLVEDGPEGKLTLCGHVSRENPQWRTFGASSEALAIFPGPHAYVSAGWYRASGVPTWNYMSVHAYGTVKVLEGTELRAVLDRLVETNERTSGSGTGYSLAALPDGYVEGMMKGIVGFFFAVERTEASFKLSQGSDPADYERVISELRGRGDGDSLRIAEEMDRRRRGSGPG